MTKRKHRTPTNDELRAIFAKLRKEGKLVIRPSVERATKRSYVTSYVTLNLHNPDVLKRAIQSRGYRVPKLTIFSSQGKPVMLVGGKVVPAHLGGSRYLRTHTPFGINYPWLKNQRLGTALYIMMYKTAKKKRYAGIRSPHAGRTESASRVWESIKTRTAHHTDYMDSLEAHRKRRGKKLRYQRTGRRVKPFVKKND